MVATQEKKKERKGKWFPGRKKKKEGKEKKRKKKKRWGRSEMNGLETSTYPNKGIKIMNYPNYPYIKI